MLPAILATAAVMGLPVLLPGVLGWLHSLIPLPVFYYLVISGYKQGAAIIAGGLLLSLIPALILGTATALVAALLLVPLGIIFFRAARGEKTAARAWMEGVLFLLGLLFILAVIHGTSSQADPYAALTEALDKGLVAGHDLRHSAELPPETLKQIESAYAELRAFLPKVLPAMILIMVMFTTGINMIIGNWLLQKNTGSSPWPSSQHWRLPDWLVWGVIMAMIALMSSPGGLNTFGLNLLLILALLYFFQGMGVLRSLLARWSVPPPLRALIYFLSMVQYHGIILIAILGVIDVWADFRRPRIHKEITE
jgi:uncharacterized protein YybS (DUF2232 family)